MDPDDKSHPKFGDVAELEFLMFPRGEQLAGKSASPMILGEAVSKVCILATFQSLFFLKILSFIFKYHLHRELPIMKH